MCLCFGRARREDKRRHTAAVKAMTGELPPEPYHALEGAFSHVVLVKLACHPIEDWALQKQSGGISKAQHSATPERNREGGTAFELIKRNNPEHCPARKFSLVPELRSTRLAT